MNLLKTLLFFAKPHKMALLLSLLCRVLNQLGTIAMLVIAGYYAQQLFSGIEVALWTEVLPLLVVIGVVKAACRYLEQVIGHSAAFSIQEDFRNRIYWQLERHAPGNIGELSSGELIARVVSDIERIEVFYAHAVVPVLSAIICTLLMFVFSCWFFSWQFAVGHLLLLLMVGALLPTWHFIKQYQTGAQLRATFGQFSQVSTDIIKGASEIQNWQAMDFYQKKIAMQGVKLQQKHNRLALFNGLKDANTDLLIASGFLLLLTLSYLTSTQLISVDNEWVLQLFTLPLLCFYAASFGPVLALTRTFEDLPQSIPSCVRVLKLLEDGFLTANKPRAKSTSAVEAVNSEVNSLLRFEQVSFAYKTDSPLLDKVSFSINSGEQVLIEGESGVGKTTLLQLATAIIDTSHGQVLIKGQPFTPKNRSSLWQSISYVPQKAVIFPASLRHNLCLGALCSDQHLHKILALVCLTDFFNKQPQGLDSQLGLSGSSISGGEAQRISLARALLRATDIYILDEAFSALDKQTEVTIRANLVPFFQDKALLEVAHKANGITTACQRWSLQNGGLQNKAEQ